MEQDIRELAELSRRLRSRSSPNSPEARIGDCAAECLRELHAVAAQLARRGAASQDAPASPG
jgi:hypothetical protein